MVEQLTTNYGKTFLRPALNLREMLPKITLSKILHRNNDVICISFERNESILNALRALPNLTWSQTHRSWYVPYAKTVTVEICNLLRNKCNIEFSPVKQQDTQRSPKQPAESQNKLAGAPSALEKLPPASLVQTEQVKKFADWLRSRRYSESTVGTYTDALSVFLRYFHHKSVEQISHEDLIIFNNCYILANQLSSSYQNQVVNAIKLFFKTIQLRSMDLELVHRPKQAHLLPNVLSKEEVKKILEAHINYKHRVMLSLIYACGLRRSELLNLKPLDISAERGLVVIRQSKGKKDRIAPVSEKMIQILRHYYVLYKPVVWLFEGQVKGEKYSGESLQQVLRHALTKAKIDKPVTLHWLRHSYATHLLEKGTDLRYIQELLGHNSSRTTEIYTHVSRNSIQKIISPFDDL